MEVLFTFHSTEDFQYQLSNLHSIEHPKFLMTLNFKLSIMNSELSLYRRINNQMIDIQRMKTMIRMMASSAPASA